MYGQFERLKAVDVVLDETGRRRVVALDLAGVFELTEDGLGENLAELRRRKTEVSLRTCVSEEHEKDMLLHPSGLCL
jgi:hypothetical protein